jgi:hypothetical protein
LGEKNNTGGGWIVVAVSDLHTGSSVGLMPPKTQLDDGGSYVASIAQRWLWTNWIKMWTRVEEIKQETKLPVCTIVNGDISDGDHHDTTQIVTRNKADQIDIALETLGPLLDVSDKVFIIRGTEAHNGKTNWMEEEIAKQIGAEPDKHTHSWWHLYIEIGGVTFDVQHHGEYGTKVPWSAGTEAVKIAAHVASEYADSGDKPPMIALRAHRHGWRDSGRTRSTQAFVTPPWQLKTAFVHRLGFGTHIQSVGGLVLVCKDGRYSVEPLIYRPRREQPRRLE